MKENVWKRLLAGMMIACLMTCFILGVLPMISHAGAETPVKPSVPEDIAAFPASYQPALIALKQKHPNWSFEPISVMDWNTAVTYEMRGGKSLIYYSKPEYMKEGRYDQGNWYYASKEILKYYMDPRNSLTENTIFQFEQLSFNENYQTLEALEKFLSGSFMGDGKLVPNTVMTFPFLIYACGKHETVRVSPFHLAARIRQEQGAGQSPLISGTYPGYEGYYNYFNFGASGKTNADVIKNGLEYAVKYWGKDLEISPGEYLHNQGAYNAIFVGSQLLASGYINKGQDTLYLQKFDVKSSTPCTHQYMQNITAPTTEASSIKTQYENAGVLNETFIFRIPVYANMPEQICALPTSSTNIVLEISENKEDPYNYTQNYVTVDGVQYLAESYSASNDTRRLIVTLPDGNAKNAWIELKDAAGNIVRGYYWDLAYHDTYYTATVGTKPVITYHTVSFEGAGASGSMDPIEVQQGTEIVLPECGFTPAEGKEFDKWSLGAPGDHVTVTEDLVITAVWKDKPEEPAIIKDVLASLDGNMGVCFLLKLPESVLSDTGAYAEFTKDGETEKILVSRATQVEKDGEVLYGFDHYVVPSEWRDTVNLKLYHGSGAPAPLYGSAGEDYSGTGINFMFETYVAGFKASGEEKVRNLAIALEDYCTCCQIYLKHNAENLTVSDRVKAVGRTELTDDHAGVFQGELPAGIKRVLLNVSFESSSSVKLLFEFEKNVNPQLYQYAIDGTPAELMEYQGTYYLMTSGITASEFADVRSYSVSDGTNTYVVSCGVLTYARACLVYGEDSIKDLGRATWLYYQAAIQ